jgi:ferredoxin
VLSRFRVLRDWRMPRNYLRTARQSMPVLPLNRRIGIAEVELGFDEVHGRAEASRCLRCQVNTVFDGSKCILCNGCVDICPERCLHMAGLRQLRGDERFRELAGKFNGRATVILKDEDRCIRCGLCAQRCPAGAITVEALEQREREVFD